MTRKEKLQTLVWTAGAAIVMLESLGLVSLGVMVVLRVLGLMP